MGSYLEGRLIAPYEATFNAMGLPEMRAWAKTLGIAVAVRKTTAESPLVIFLLGSRYLEAVAPPVVPDRGQRFVFFAKPSETHRLRATWRTRRTSRQARGDSLRRRIGRAQRQDVRAAG